MLYGPLLAYLMCRIQLFGYKFKHIFILQVMDFTKKKITINKHEHMIQVLTFETVLC